MGRSQRTSGLNEVRFTALAEGWPAQEVIARCGDPAREALRDLEAFPVTCGNQVCAACHIYLPPNLSVAPADDVENALIDLADAPRRCGSRLACQVQVTELWQGTLIEIATPLRPRH